jgi:hypothetical protein
MNNAAGRQNKIAFVSLWMSNFQQTEVVTVVFQLNLYPTTVMSIFHHRLIVCCSSVQEVGSPQKFILSNSQRPQQFSITPSLVGQQYPVKPAQSGCTAQVAPMSSIGGFFAVVEDPAVLENVFVVVSSCAFVDDVTPCVDVGLRLPPP